MQLNDCHNTYININNVTTLSRQIVFVAGPDEDIVALIINGVRLSYGVAQQETQAKCNEDYHAIRAVMETLTKCGTYQSYVGKTGPA